MIRLLFIRVYTFLSPVPLWCAVVLPVLLVSVVLAACGTSRPAQPEQRPTPLEPAWEQAAFVQHLRILNGTDVGTRATGTQGFARAAAYVADRMREFHLQPVLHDEYRVLYVTPLHSVRSALLQGLATDTLALYPAIDYLPDARSDSGTVYLREMQRMYGTEAEIRATLASDGTLLAGDVGILLTPDQATASLLRSLRDAGVQVVFVERPLMPAQAVAPVRDLVVVQVTPRTAARLGSYFRRVAAPWARRGASDTPPLRVRVVAEQSPTAGALNVMGYVAGSHPVLASELIIVCSDLDALEAPGAARVLDFEHFGTDVAAMLELARRYGTFGHQLSVPDRTILFAAWSGSLLDDAGLRAYLRRPLWSLDATRGVIYLGLAPEREAEIRALLAPHGIPLYAVPPEAKPLHESPAVLIPDAALRRAASAVTPSLPMDPSPDLSQIIDTAAVQARRLASIANDLLLARAISPRPPVPMLHPVLPPAEPPGE